MGQFGKPDRFPDGATGFRFASLKAFAVKHTVIRIEKRPPMKNTAFKIPAVLGTYLILSGDVSL